MKASLPSKTCPSATHRGSANRRRCVAVQGGMGDFFKNIFDFNSWAPRSTKIWRLNQYAYTEGDLIGKKAVEGSAVDVLEAQMRAARGGAGQGGAVGTNTSSSMEASASLTDMSDMDGAQLAAAFNRRAAQLTQLLAEEEEPDVDAPLTGAELRELIAMKYGKRHDVSIARRDIPGKTLVSLNIMWNHMEQRSFKLTEQQYEDKLDSIAYVVSSIGQAARVREFMKQPPRAERGLPARPVVGTAVSIRFNLDEAVVKEWFGNGYQ